MSPETISDAHLEVLAAEHQRLAAGRDVGALGLTFERFVRARVMHERRTLDRAAYRRPSRVINWFASIASIGRA